MIDFGGLPASTARARLARYVAEQVGEAEAIPAEAGSVVWSALGLEAVEDFRDALGEADLATCARCAVRVRACVMLAKAAPFSSGPGRWADAVSHLQRWLA